MARLPTDEAQAQFEALAKKSGAPVGDRTLEAQKAIEAFTVPGGRFGILRPKSGSTPAVWHWGSDLGPFKAGTPVVAPEDMDYVAHWDFGPGNMNGGSSKVHPASIAAEVGFDGYGPAGVVAKGKSGVFHLLAHMDPEGWSDSAPSASFTNPADPASIRSSSAKFATPGTTIHWIEGEQVGRMAPLGGGPHVHWELRQDVVDTPATRGATTFDPVKWLGTNGTDHVLVTRPPPTTRSSSWMLWVLLGLVLYERRRR